MEADFRTLMLSDAPIAAIVGERISPTIYPQKTDGTAIRFRKVAGDVGLHMQGSDGFGQARMQVDLRAATAAEAVALRDAIVARLHAYAGDVGETTFRLIKLRSDRGLDYDTSTSTHWFTCSIDFDVWWAA